MIGDSRPGSLAGAESSGAADLVTAAPTGPIYQLIWGVMHYQLGSREPGQNIAIARNHGRWEGATRQACERQREGFRECDSEGTNLTVSWMWHIKLNRGCEVGWSLRRDWWPSCSHSSCGSYHEECPINNLADWSHTVKCVCLYVLALSTTDHIFTFRGPAIVFKAKMRVLGERIRETLCGQTKLLNIEHWQVQGRKGVSSDQ